ncbi:MAG: SDR family oxidoreductase [Sphingomonadales bacterium]|nr:SDR family oxidoreductase [Sphingomonadales bacterium]
MISNKDKTILVTGAARGIGAAIAIKILEGDGNVVIHYNASADRAEKLVAKYGADRVLALKADLANRDEVKALWKAAWGWKGRLDGLVNNAASMSEVTPEMSDEVWENGWDDLMAVNTIAVADLCRLAILDFKTIGGGSIVNIASRAAFRGDMPDSMHYAASKGAVVALTRSIAKGYAQDNIMAYIVAPGWVGTERVMPRLNAPENAFMMKEIPMGQPAPPEEVGNIVAFLLAGLAKNATGTTIDINGASYFH